MEAVTHSDISKVQITIQELTAFKTKEAGLDHFWKELQTQLVPALEGMSDKIQHL